MRILYLGDSHPDTTSGHRSRALQRLGHDVCTFRPIDAVRWNSLNRAIHYRLGFRLVVGRVRKYLLDRIKSIPPFDLVWVDSGELVGSALLKDLRRTGAILVNYNSDDPTGRRDRGRWGTLLAAIPEYDLCVVVRRESEDEYRSRGAPRCSVFGALRTRSRIVQER